MATAQLVRSEVDKPEEADPVKEVIRWVVKALLQEEERALVTEMLEYRNNLSRHLLNRLSERDLGLVLRRVGRSGRSGPRLSFALVCRVPEHHVRWGGGPSPSRPLKNNEGDLCICNFIMTLFCIKKSVGVLIGFGV